MPPTEEGLAGGATLQPGVGGAVGGVGGDLQQGGRSAVGGGAPAQIKTTRPDAIKRHDISDEELEMLANDSPGRLSNAFWTFCGGAIAAAGPCFEALHGAYFASPVAPLSGVDLSQVVTFMVSAAVAVALGLVERERSKRASSLVQKIRRRKQHA